MMYEPGDYVCPSDLPRRFLCRVEQVESVGDGFSQILKLEPLEGPWPGGTRLIRLDGAVAPVPTRALWRRRGRVRSAAVQRPRMRDACCGRPRRRLTGQITR
jgi:hypothetical protein